MSGFDEMIDDALPVVMDAMNDATRTFEYCDQDSVTTNLANVFADLPDDAHEVQNEGNHRRVRTHNLLVDINSTSPVYCGVTSFSEKAAINIDGQKYEIVKVSRLTPNKREIMIKRSEAKRRNVVPGYYR